MPVLFKVPAKQANCFFLTHTSTYDHVLYKAAIAEELAPGGHKTGSYAILLQCEQGTQAISLFKEDSRWYQESKVGNKALVELIGSIIDKARK